MEQVLVLDVGYRPVDVISWQDAIVKVVIDKSVEVVSEYPDKFINTVSWTVKMPSIVRLLAGVKRTRAVRYSRHNIFARDRGRCQYCSCTLTKATYTIDHVLPRAQGGKTSWENVVLCCVPCNQQKGGRTPAQAKMALRSSPVRPKKLDNVPSFDMTYRPSMDESWKDYLRSAVYWDGALEEE